MKKKLIIATLLASTLLTTSACGEKATSTKESDTPPTQKVTEQTTKITETETQRITETETEEPTVLPKTIGETATIGDWSITISNMQILDSISADYGSFKADEGNKFILITGKVENTAKESARFLPTIGMNDDVSAKIIYGDGYEFSASNLMGYEKDLHDSSINPLSSMEGDLAFQIPDSVASSEEELLLRFNAGSETLVYKVR